jgi:5'-deoxynucleotidase YfbR-like HD superfamily hydrolase
MQQIINSRSKFYACLSKLRWIKRWNLIRNPQPENVMKHGREVTVIATSALTHDTSKVLATDLPAPIKYFASSLTIPYREIETIVCQDQSVPSPHRTIISSCRFMLYSSWNV